MALIALARMVAGGLMYGAVDVTINSSDARLKKILNIYHTDLRK
jgi:hypothetical protein